MNFRQEDSRKVAAKRHKDKEMGTETGQLGMMKWQVGWEQCNGGPGEQGASGLLWN